MQRFLVVVLDGTKARFLTLAPVEFPETESGPNLIEQDELLNPANEMAGQDLWANTKTGRNRGSGGQSHNYDDHRSRHIAEFGRKFAQEVTTHIDDLIREHQSDCLVLIAEPQILGLLRESLHASNGRSVTIHEMAKDLCRLKSREIHEYLTKKEILPARQRALSTRR